jgi:hypothetical protein
MCFLYVQAKPACNVLPSLVRRTPDIEISLNAGLMQINRFALTMRQMEFNVSSRIKHAFHQASPGPPALALNGIPCRQAVP